MLKSKSSSYPKIRSILSHSITAAWHSDRIYNVDIEYLGSWKIEEGLLSRRLFYIEDGFLLTTT
eukprot:snap_masked-scaffold_2-processed-gene-24.18-mRNA-1 protein AED:1.00 eAED:1.00 QI:0/0/0/0/1/1/2/0/63